MDRIDPELLKRYAEGQCTEEEQALIEQWLEQEDNIFEDRIPSPDRSHRTFLKKEVWDGFVEKIALRKFLLKLRFWGMGIGASSLILFLIWWFSMPTSQHKPATPNLITAETPLGKQMKIRLPDSSVAWLAGGTKLCYPAAFTDSIRELHLLSGEAYFDIRHQAQHPFRITTTNSRIDVLGTRFSIRNRDYLSQLRITLEQGSVRFTDFRGTTYLLAPGEQVNYDKDSKQLADISTVPADRIASWRNGILWFKATPMPEALKALEEYYGVTFQVIGHPDLDIPLTGKFDRLSLSRVLQLLEQTTPLHFRLKEKTVTIQ